MKPLRNFGKSFLGQFQGVNRDPRYILVLLWSVPLYALMMIQALHKGWFDSFERPVFHFFNNLPHFLSVPFYIVTQFGSLGSLVVWAGVAWYLVSRRAAWVELATGFAAWLVAKFAKAYVHRGRPQDLFHSVHLFHDRLYSGYGFPSGHATFSAACATVLYYQLKPSQRKYLVGVVVFIGLSRMYLGAHLPFDVVGGWALGITIGAIVSIIAGGKARTASVATIKRVLARSGMTMKSVQMLQVDARGSRPLVLVGEDGTKYFGKIFGKQEHAADWLFKLYRFFRYKNLQAEEPYVNARRNVEMESFASLWARRQGVRVPEILGLYKIGSDWLLLQERIDAKTFPELIRYSDKSLADAWRQVKKLHDGDVAHRDLRAANLMIDTSGSAWLIDFGFAEIAPSKRRKNMDVAELLMSMSLVVGVERTVAAAKKVLGAERLKRALPYLQQSVFSGATTAALRKDKGKLKELQQHLQEELKLKDEIEPAKIDRFNAKKLISVGLLGFFIYIILPQFKQFRGNLNLLQNVHFEWLIGAALFSILSYVAAAMVYVALAPVPLRVRHASIIQLAASFVSKVIPGGIGGTALNGKYLNRQGLDAAESSAVITAQNVIGIVMFTVPLLLFLLFAGHSVSELVHVRIDLKIVYVIVAVLLIVGMAVGISKRLRRKATGFTATLLATLRELSASPRELGLAAVASFAITVCYIGCLYMCMLAFGLHLTLTAAILIYASAIIAKSVVPTPGGLGPIEVTMAAALIGYSVPTLTAYAVVVLYRLATFWIPIPFSLLAYRYATAKRLI